MHYVGTDLKKKIENREPLAGTLVTLSDPAVTEMIGALGYDFVWIDMEHSPLDYEEVRLHIMAAKASDTLPIVRVPQNDYTLLKKVIDMGPAGVIVPMVNTVEDARAAVSSCRYPPEGTRGWGPYGAIRYGIDNKLEWISRYSHDLCVFLQIEHIDAVEHLNEIADVEGVDGFVIGPCDLSGSIGQLYRMYEPETVAVIDRAIGILTEKGRYIGMAGGSAPEVIEFWQARGVHMITAGLDYGFIVSGASSTLQSIRKIQKR